MPLRILHLSDIHFSTKFDDELIVHTDVRAQLLNDIGELAARLGSFDAVLLAGDVAFAGKRSEYQIAAAWLEQVTTACGCPTTSVLAVPGNHDVDRDRITPATRLIHRRLRTCSLPEASREIIELAESNDGSLTDKLTDYQAFASSYGCHFASPARPHWSRTFPLAPNRILNFSGLTSVQVCDGEDQKGGLLLGAHQYVIDRTPCVERIVILHHPFEWLKDRSDADRYLARARILVFGHDHIQEIHKIVDINGEERLVIGSGAVTPEHSAYPYIYRYNVLEFSLNDGPIGCPALAVTIYPRIWVTERTRFGADSTRLAGQESATFLLACPQFNVAPPISTTAHAGNEQPHFGHIAMQPISDEGFERLRYLFWRYLDGRARLQVLVQADILPAVVQAPLPQTVEHLALERAKAEDKLAKVWDLVMPHIPTEKRGPNPFSVTNR